MRWYCVHPSLPLQAELRIRAAPDSNAAERSRICQGRAIAACSPIFYVPGDSIDVDTIAWLQVAYQDVDSGTTEGGFVMAALPDGTELVTPWELTDFYGCCEVVDSGALLFDGPQEMAKTLGSVSGINFLYCIVEENDKRVRVFHPEMESVWIEKKNVQMVCTRLKHEECSTLHTFYELNEALPEEAQIAIREFPSKEAQTVGLLSRGETLEVIVRGGNWLQIAGGLVDKAWVMWRTDALELLQEAPDVCSNTCKRIETKIADTVDGRNIADQAGWGDAQVEPSSFSQTVDETTSTSPVALGIDEVAAREIDKASDVVTTANAKSVNVTSAVAVFPTSSTTEGDAIYTKSGESLAGWYNGKIRPASTALNGEDDIVSVDDSLVAAAVDDDGITTASGFVLDNNADDVEHGQAHQTWDDRPIRPAISRSTIAEPETDLDGIDDINSVGVVDWQHEIESDATVINNEVESEIVDTMLNHAIESDAAVIDEQVELAVPEHYGASESAAFDKGEVAEIVQTTSHLDTDVDSSTIDDARNVEFVQASCDPDIKFDTAAIDYTEETRFGQAISDQNDTGIDPAATDDGRDVELVDAMTNHNAGSESGAVNDLGEPQLGQTSPDKGTDNSSPIDNAEEIGSVDRAPDHDIDIDSAVIDDTELEFVDTAPDQDTDINFSTIDDETEVGLALKHDTDIDSSAVCDAVEVERVKNAPVHGPDIEYEEMELVEPAPAPDNNADDEPSVIDGVEMMETVLVSSSIFGGESAVMDGVGIVETVCAPCDDAIAVDSAEEAGSAQIALDLDAESDFNAKGDSEAVTSGATVMDRAEEAGPVQITLDLDAESDFNAKGDSEAVTSEATVMDSAEEAGPVKTTPDLNIESDFNVNDSEAVTSEATVMVSAEETGPVQTIPDFSVESDFNVNDSEAVTLAKTAPAEEVGLVQTVSPRSNHPGVIEDVLDENETCEKLRDANVAGANLLVRDSDTCTVPHHHTASDYPSALDESSAAYSGTGHPKSQEQHSRQLLNPLTAFETRYADSEATSGSENGEIALLGTFEDVFDPVDELLPAVEEGVCGGSPGSLPSTRKENPVCQDDKLIEEKWSRCDCNGVLHSACRPSQEKTVPSQPDGIRFLEQFGTIKYCERKQLIYPMNDKLSFAMLNADQDDADLVFEVLVGDDPLSDDWFHDIASRKVIETLSAAVSNGYAQTLFHSFSKESGYLLEADSKDTYALIMSGAAPEVILESELLDDDDGNYDLVSSFRYPLPKRRIERRGSNSSLKYQHSTLLCEDVSANATTSSIRTVVSTVTTPPASPQWSPPQTATSPNPKLVHRNSFGASNTSVKPQGVLVRPRSFAQTPATTSAMSTPSRLAQPALGVASSKLPGSLLQRRSFLPTPSPPKVPNTSTRIDSKAAESSGLPIPRKSFGFRRPSSLQKK